jgi:hypothetical protein
MARCRLCGKYFKIITNTHLKVIHNCRLRDYTKKFGTKNCGFLSPNILPKNDPRYIKWKRSLKKRPPPWNKGYTKETHPNVAKISRTFKKKKIDNFARWRERMIKKGWIKINYPSLKKSGDLAELIGVILGDGNIYKHPRTEELRISSNSEDKKFIKRYERLVDKNLRKKPKLERVKNSNCIYIRIYQKDISKRLGVPAGKRKKQKIRVPLWILRNKIYLIRYLRGIYEAEGSFCIHKPTYTYKFLFTNTNKSLLDNVYQSLKILGFHPHRSKNRIQISRREEVYKIKDLLKFRQY